jgi:hypothetical protein
MSRRVAIIGSRDFPELWMVRQFVMWLPKDFVVVSGGAKGVDSRAVYTAKKRGMTYKEWLPDYETYGSKIAPHKRNDQILDDSDVVVAFWTGNKQNSGTYSVIEKARQRGQLWNVFEPIKESDFEIFRNAVRRCWTGVEGY